MQEQSERLKKTGRTLRKIEKSAVPGLDRMIGMIKRIEVRNRVVIALVIAICLAIIMYYHLIRPITSGGGGVPEVVTAGMNATTMSAVLPGE